MKISQERYNELRDGIEKVIEHYGRERIRQKFREQDKSKHIGMLWEILNVVTFDYMYSDDCHPAYKTAKIRVLEHRPGWNIYQDGINDAHIETALKKIARELFLSE